MALPRGVDPLFPDCTSGVLQARRRERRGHEIDRMERQIKRFEWMRLFPAGRQTSPPGVQLSRSAGRVGGVFDDELDLPVAAPGVGSEVAGEVQCAAAVLQQRRAERTLL